MKNTLTIRLDDEAARELALAAKRARKSRGAIVRELIRTQLPNGQKNGKPSAWDLMKDLAGIVKDGPRNLSTNKKYMKNFGTGRRPW